MTEPGREPGRSESSLREEVERRTWFHTIDLGQGVITPGHKDTPSELPHMHLPADLRGCTVLDIGAYDGFYSFEAERRGASRVLATDSWAWNWPDSDARRNFDLARHCLDSHVDQVDVSVEGLGPDVVGGPFDVVLFLGVLYHAPDPLGYLRRVRDVTGGFAIIETVVDLLDLDVPAIAYYPADALNKDASNYFGPNPAALEGMALDAGFSRVVSFAPWTISKENAIDATLTTDLGRVARLRRRFRRPRSGRMVIHAYV